MTRSTSIQGIQRAVGLSCKRAASSLKYRDGIFRKSSLSTRGQSECSVVQSPWSGAQGHLGQSNHDFLATSSNSYLVRLYLLSSHLYGPQTGGVYSSDTTDVRAHIQDQTSYAGTLLNSRSSGTDSQLALVRTIMGVHEVANRRHSLFSNDMILQSGTERLGIEEVSRRSRTIKMVDNPDAGA